MSRSNSLPTLYDAKEHCMYKYLTVNPINKDRPALKIPSANQKNKNTLLKEKSRLKTNMSVFEKNDFIEFLFAFKDVSHSLGVPFHIIPFDIIDDLVKIYNHCFHQKLSLVKLDTLGSSNDIDRFIWFKDYSELINLVNSGKQNFFDPKKHRIGMTESVYDPNALKIMEIRNKYKIYKQM